MAPKASQNREEHNQDNQHGKGRTAHHIEGRFFVRVSDTTMDEVEKAFGDVQTIEPDDLPDEFGFITPVMKQAEYKEKISKLTGKVLAMIRVKD